MMGVYVLRRNITCQTLIYVCSLKSCVYNPQREIKARKLLSKRPEHAMTININAASIFSEFYIRLIFPNPYRR